MPGRDYNQAYALLEQQLKHSSYLSSERHSAISEYTEIDDSEDSNTPDIPFRVTSPRFTPPPLSEGRTSTLPSPPSDESPLGPPTRLTHDLSYPFATGLLGKSRLSYSPIQAIDHTRLQPNPDPSKLAVDSFASLYAESFQTAREVFSGPTSDASRHQTPINHIDLQQRLIPPTPELVRSDIAEAAMPSLRRRPDVDTLHVDEPLPETPNANITPKQSRYEKQRYGTEDLGLDEVDDDSIGELRDSLLSRSPTNGERRLENSPSTSLKQRKTYSGASSDSPVIQAVIFDRTPPQVKRTLRHVQKDGSLREKALNSEHSNRTSLNSDEVHRLTHQPKRDSLDADFRKGTSTHADGSLRGLFARDKRDDHRPSTAPDRSSKRVSFPDKYDNVSPLFFGFPKSSSRSVSDPLSNADQRNSVATYQSSDPQLNVYRSNRRSTDQYSLQTESLPRHSLDHSLLHLGGTPLSFKSEGTSGPVEVREATAVSIYPHNNNSLLVVQHPPSVDLRRNTVDTPRSQTFPTNGAFITLEASTPTPPLSSYEYAEVSSPLKNPRTPPEPPIVAVIPPTPARELEDADVAPRAQTKEVDDTPTRKTSLLKRARRYSDNVMQPIIGRGVGSRRRPQRTQKAYPEASSPAKENGNLHPFWHPRGFWDDISDSSDSEDYDYDYEPESDRLPVGGDTRDVPDERKSGSMQRGNSIRGFLLGNSLGLERGPTNRRPHVVNKPITVRDSVKRSGSTGRRKTKKPSAASRVFAGWRQRLHASRTRKDEQAREEKRDELRKSIGTRFYVVPNEI